MRIRFGECTFDTGRHEVRRGEETVHLAPKAFFTALQILEHRLAGAYGG